jgi:hypothetical protein
MNNQEIFDTVARHIIKQGKPAVNEYGDCKYRTADGSMCAVGVLIPDDVYTEDMEWMVPDHLATDKYISVDDGAKSGVLLLNLQAAHDMDLMSWDDDDNIVPDFDTWASAMRHIAKEYSLNTNVLYDALKEAGHNVSN